MSFVVKKRDLTDPAQLQALIVEHADDLERGLTILDSRLLLGQATIDVVGVDADGSLVLIALGLIADEEMFLRAVEAYSWCLEYPEAIRRLSPTVQISSTQPPRVMFVVDRMPDAFHRKIKQLGFADVDCVEFRHLDVDGTPAVYFNSLARLRRGVIPTAAMPDQNGAPPAPVTNGRPTSLKLQKLLGADRPVAGREPAPVVRMVHRAIPRPEARPLAGRPRIDRGVAPRQASEEPAAPVASVVEAFAGLGDPLAQAVGAADAMVEPFVTVERLAENGRVDALPLTIGEPEPAEAPAPPAVPEVLVVERFTLTADPVVPQPLTTDDASTLAVDAPEPEMVAATLTEPDPEFVVPGLLELEPRQTVEIAADPTPLAAVLAEPITTEPDPVAVPIVIEPSSVPEPATLIVTEAEPEPPAALIVSEPEPIVIEPEVAAPVVTEAEPSVAPLSVEPLEPIPPVAPVAAPSVFARRPPEAAVTRAEPKVSFAGMAKELLPPPQPLRATEPPVSIQRPSVEEITRGALDELVGATEKRATEERAPAFVKPSGPFAKSPSQKRPRTIAPPPSDGEPIGAGPKLGTCAKRAGAPPPGPEPAAATEADATQPVPQGFEGLQFPNDGVLTRQWMEFLNQMAAGK